MCLLHGWKNGNVILNEESIDYKWFTKDEFIEMIEWNDNKEILSKVVDYALDGKKYFQKPKVQVYE